MKMIDSVIHKPWGEEYIFFENRHLSIWFLKIKKNESTSLHCHPDKKTGLILLNGKAKIKLIERNFTIKGLSKIMIRNECFHKTKAISQDIEILEIETPKNKKNLVRIKDNYGRVNKGYESKSHWRKRDGDNLFLKNSINEKIKHKNINFQISVLSKDNLSKLKKDSLIIILNGHAFKNNEYNFCSKGEVLTVETAIFLSSQYKINKNIKIISISND